MLGAEPSARSAGLALPCRRPRSRPDLRLTPREISVLVLLAEGHMSESAARRLGCYPHTVHKHLGRLHRKLGASDRLMAVLEAQRL